MADQGQQTQQSLTTPGAQSASDQTGGAQGGASQQTQSSQGTTSQTASAAKTERPDWLPENFWDKDKSEIRGGDLRKQFDDLTAFKAGEESKRLSRPQKGEDYALDLPKDFKLPQGVEFQIDANDPLIAQYRGLAVEAGLDQGTFSKGLGLIAALRVGDQQMIETARNAEIQKLGANATARVDAVMNFAKATVGEDLAGALGGMLVTAKHVQAFEALIQKFTTQGGASYSQQHRDQSTEKVSDDKWNSMSSTERLAYAREHASKAA